MAVQTSSGNVFADLECANPEALLLKADLIIALRDVTKTQRWSGADLARQLNIPKKRAHQLLRGHFNEFTLDEIVGLATGAGVRTKIILPTPASTTPFI
ncbi:hypothetical protein D3C87_954200 [compost metagenome]